MAVSRPSLLLLLALPLISGQGLDCSQTTGFKQGAEDLVKVRYRETFRRGQTKKVFTQAEVMWQPNEMLAEPACYNLAAAELMMRPAGSSEWQLLNERQSDAGMYAKWIVDIKPCLKYQFKIQVIGNSVTGGESYFELPQTLGPATQDEILNSKYLPEAPSNFHSEVGANSAMLNWDEADCADAYEVSYREVGSAASSALLAPTSGNDNLVNVESLKPCTRYQASIFALLGDEYSESDLVSSFATKPRLDSAADLEPKLIESLDSVVVSWKAWESMSCIDEYKIKICERPSGQCKDTQIVKKPQGLPSVTFTVGSLEPCTDYTMEIQPVFPDTEIESKFVDFRTLSPSADTLSVKQVQTKSVSSGSMIVDWTDVKCAGSYKVYQKETSATEWSEIAETEAEQNEITVDNITPCTKYHFAISAVLADGSETSRTVGPELISDLDEKDPFTAPNIYIKNADTQADISWGHADCIGSYLLKFCQRAYTDCREEAVNPVGNEDKTVNHRINGLEPCTHYSLEIIPVIPGKPAFTAKPIEFTTTNGIPQAPSDFKVQLLKKGATSLSWSPAQCATGYKIYSKTAEEEDPSVEEVTSDLEKRFEHPTPCETYFYSVVTLVDELESAKSEWVSVPIPPNPDALPELKILNKEKDNVTLRLKPSDPNKHCTVAEYELSFSSDGSTFAKRSIKATDVGEDGDLKLAFKGATEPDAIITARVLYESGNVWSEKVTYGQRNSPMKASFGGAGLDTTYLIPIIVGVGVFAIIVIVITIIILRRKRSRSGYDTEKVENGNRKLHHNNASDEETQKLNTHQPED